MNPPIITPLGVCVIPEAASNVGRTVTYPGYVHEILSHAGVCYQIVRLEDLPEALPGLAMLLTVGEAGLTDDTVGAIRAWVEAGGAWISVAGTLGLAETLGVEVEQPALSEWRGGGVATLGEGYLKAEDASHPMMGCVAIPLHYFNGLAVRATAGKAIASCVDSHQRPTERAAVVERQVGRGRTLLICPDIAGTVVRIQQGTAVTRDGVSAPDGGGSVCDGVLKTDDGQVLDWTFDREPVPGVPGFDAFLQPIADQWRELLLRGIFHLANKSKIALPMLWLYPRNLPALAHLSHDSDGNDPHCAHRMIEVLDETEIRSTWCVMAPGYPAETVDAIRGHGHELALHFDAYSEGIVWSEEEFDRQWREITNLFGGERITSNKNHFLRWEGDTEFFGWLARRGIQFDANKGASKTGEAGFNFGFCHPYFPVDADGQMLDVLEISTISQDLGRFAPIELGEPLLQACLKVNGIMHMVFHPAHIVKPGVAETLSDLIARAKSVGMEWWTGRQINSWERARRTATWSDYAQTSDGARVTLTLKEDLTDITVMWLTSDDAQVTVNGVEEETSTITRWGFSFRSVVFDIGRERESVLVIK